MANIRDVAKAANVSITTVSRILSHDSTLHVSEETKQRVFQVVNELNYNYKQKKKQINIGCIMSLTYSYSDPYFSDILNGIQSYCAKNNAVISLIVSYSQIKEINTSLKKSIMELDGLIITDLPDNKLQSISKLNNNLVFIDHYVNGYCNVGYNKIFANQLIMDHLVSCNYKKIAYIGGPEDDSNFDHSQRLMVYRESLRKNQIEFDPELIYNCEWDPILCEQQTLELLNKRPDIEAIFAGSDSLATIIIRQLNKMNKRCPEDIGVVGFNDNSVSQHFTPPITTVRLPSRDMGEIGAKMLIDKISIGHKPNIQILLPVELKIRNSTSFAQ